MKSLTTASRRFALALRRPARRRKVHGCGGARTSDFTPDNAKYCGHTVRMSGWIKTENVSEHIHPNLRPKGPNFKLLAKDTMIKDTHIRGTLDWTKYSLTCVISKDTQCLDTGFAFMGSGKVWLDTNSLKYEIVK